MAGVFGACGNRVWVGNAEICDAAGLRFDAVIHVRHEDSPTPGVCKAFHESPEHGLFIKYLDGHLLGDIIGQVEKYVRESDGKDLLCHCAAGLCRGPTMAIIAKVVRGCTPWQAMADVSSAVWAGYRSAPMLISEPMTEIFWWYWKGPI